ncbi:MAG: diaminopimelate decarboxylase [Clostridia bacterium]|nr:diaminopimelate decarboxylase [Clostridia bacterium]
MKLHGTMTVNSRGHLEIGGCDTVSLAGEFGTPLIVLDEALIRETCRQYIEAFVKPYPGNQVVYASKAFSSPAFCRIMAEEGVGLDVVSGGELYFAIMSHFPAKNIFFHGNNKSPAELEMALSHQVGYIVVDNADELKMLNSLAASLGVKPAVLLRITPGVEAHTHEYIQTGQIDSKFGFTLPNGQALAAVKSLADYPCLDFKGVHCHIGSQVFEMDSYAHTARIMFEFLVQIRQETGIVCPILNLGGGFGIYYTAEDRPATIEDYAAAVMDTVKECAGKYNYPLPRVIIEPGRSIIGNAGTTLYTVGTIKTIPGFRKYVAVDGGMADNIRPSLYQAKYEAAIANKMNLPAEVTVSVTGKCCESGDMLIWDIELPQAERGDILAVPSTGAYSYAMASNYNNLARPAVVLVREGKADLIIERESYEDLIRKHKIPARLQGRNL